MRDGVTMDSDFMAEKLKGHVNTNLNKNKRPQTIEPDIMEQKIIDQKKADSKAKRSNKSKVFTLRIQQSYFDMIKDLAGFECSTINGLLGKIITDYIDENYDESASKMKRRATAQRKFQRSNEAIY